MLDAQDTISVVPNKSHYETETPNLPGVPDVLGDVGGVPSILPAQTNYDPGQMFDDWLEQPTSQQAQMQPERFNWKQSGADQYIHSDRYRAEGFDPFMGTTDVNGKTYDLNLERYDQLQTWGDVMKSGVGQFWGLTKNTFVSSIEGEGRLLNALFNWGNGESAAKIKESLIGTPEELAIQDEQQKAIFNKYPIFHGSSADASTFNKQFVGDIIGQTGFAVGPMAEFLGMSLLTAGVGEVFSLATKGLPLVGEAKALTLAAQAEKAVPLAERINDLRKVNDISRNTRLMEDIMGGLKQAGRWSAKQLNPMTGIDDIIKASEAGASTVQLGVTSVGALKRLMGQSNMAFNEARFEAAGTFGQLYGDLIAKYHERNGHMPEGEELERIKKTAYGASTDNFIVNSGIIMTMNQIQFGSLFSKFSSTSKVLREALESGAAEAFEVSGKIEGKAATRIYSSGRLGAVGQFNNIRKDFGLGTALWSVGRKMATGTAARFEISEGVQEILQEASNKSLTEYYTNLYDGRKDVEGVSLLAPDYMKGIRDQYNKEGWKTFLMGALTGYLISPLQAGVMYSARKGYGRFNETYRKEAEGRNKTIQDAIDLQNSFYKDPKNALNPAIANWKIIGQANKNMEQGLKEGDKYTFFNAKDDVLTSTVAAALKTNTLPSLLEHIREIATTWTDQQIAEAFPAAVAPDGNLSDVKGYIASMADSIEQYHKNWEGLKEEFGHLVMPELYRSNKEEYTKALYAKRALDEAIELLATTDYKATSALKRAGDIKNRFAGIPGVGGSISKAFDILSSEDQMQLEIDNLSQQIALGNGLQLDKQARDLREHHKEQLKQLTEWQRLYNEWRDDVQQFKEKGKETVDHTKGIERQNAMVDVFEAFITAHNNMGVSPQRVDRVLLKRAFGELGQYMALNRDADQYVQALNTLADPRRFADNYTILRKALEDAAKKLEKEANKEATDTIKDTYPEDEEDTTPEDVVEGDTDRITRIAQYILDNNGAILPEDEEFVQNNRDAIMAEYRRLLAERNTTDDTDSDTTDDEEDEEEPEEEKSLEQQSFHITKINDMSRVVPVDQAANDAILSTVPVDVLRDNITVIVRRNRDRVTIVDSGNGRYKVQDSRRDDGVKMYPAGPAKYYTKEQAEQKIRDIWTPKQLADKDKVNNYVTVSPQEYSIQLSYNGQVLGYATDPDVYTFNFGQGNIPADQLSMGQFLTVFRVPQDRTPEDMYKEFIDSYKQGAEVKRQLQNIMGSDTEAVLTGRQAPMQLVVSPGQYATIPEIEAEDRGTLQDLITGGRELIGVVDMLRSTEVLNGDDTLVAQVPEETDILGNYRAAIRMPNGSVKWVQLKAPVIQDEQLEQQIKDTNDARKTIVQKIADKETVTATDVTEVNKLRDVFITTIPNSSTYYYINISQKDGSYHIATETGVGKGKVRKTYKLTGELPTDPEKFREKLTKEIRKITPKVVTGTKKIMEDMGLSTEGVFDIEKYEVQRNNVRQSISMAPTQEEVMSLVPTVSQNIVKNIILSYISRTPVDTYHRGTPLPKTQVVPTAAPMAGGGNVNIQIGTTQPIVEEQQIDSRIADIERRRQEEIDAQAFQIYDNIDTYEVKDDDGIYKIQIRTNKRGEKIIYVNYGEKTWTRLSDTSYPKEVSDSKLLEFTDGDVKHIKTQTGDAFLQELKDKGVKGTTVTEKINAKYDAEIAALQQPVQETPKTTAQEMANMIAAKKERMASRSKRGKGAKKVLTEQQAGQYVENIQKFKDWVHTNLPDTISVEELDNLAQDLTNNNITVGEFLTAILDTGKIGGRIRVTPSSVFKYHEAFHAVFRLLLPQERIDRLLIQAAKESPVSPNKLADMRALHSDYMAMDDEELTERYYEEYLADKFDEWKSNRAVNTHHGIKGFFAKLWDIIQKIAAILTRNDIKRLFYQVDEGQFRNVQVQPNQFTEDTAFIDSVSSVKKVIEVGVKDLTTPDGPLEVTKYLPQQEGDILSPTVAALFFRDIQTRGQFNTREVLDSIIDRYAELYDPAQQKYIDLIDSIPDTYMRKQMMDKLTDYYLLFTEDIGRQSLREAVHVHLKIGGIKQELEDDDYEQVQEEVGERNTDNFDRNSGTIGGYKSLAKGLRQYIAGTVLPYTDVFGNTQFNDGTPLYQAANANYVYNGLLKALSNSSDTNTLMQRLWTYYKGQGNEQTTAFIQRLIDDTGLNVAEDGTWSINREENAILIQQVLKGFNQYEVDHLHTLIDKDNNYITTVANKQKAADNQLNLWSQAFENQFYNGLGKLSPKAQKEYALKAFSPFNIINKEIGTTDRIAKKIGNKDLAELSRTVSNELRVSLGINLHPTYISYSIAYNKLPEVRTKAQSVLVESFRDVPAISPDWIALIKNSLVSGQNIFSKEVGIAGRDKETSRELRLMAEGNANFDETVNTMSYVTADGETVYAHQLPTFYNRSIYDLNKESTLNRYRQDENRQSSYLLTSKEFQYLSEQGMIRALSTDGMRRETENKEPGIVYGDYNKREKLAYLMGMYAAARKVTMKKGSFYVVPHEIRVVEAKNSAPYIYLPVIKAVVGQELSKDALNKMTAIVQSEVDRIARVREELQAIERGEMSPIEGYHTGAQRGLRLFEAANMVGGMRSDIEAGNVDTAKLHEQLNRYWKEQAETTIQMMVDTGLIHHDIGAGKYTNRLAPSYLFNGMEGERGDSLNLTNDLFHNVMQVVVDDYINTEAINTLLLGNEAAAFKDGVDRNKRAAGANASIVSMTVDVLCPKWGIDAPLHQIHHVTYKSHEFNKMNGGRGDKDDAQMYITEKALRYMLFGFGKLNQTQVDILNKLAVGEHVTQHEFFGAGGLKEKGPFNSYKLVHFDGSTYLKCSALPLFREWVSIPDGEGGWVANPETEELHNLLNKMEEQERRLEEQGQNIVVFAHPTTASKAFKQNVVEDVNDIDENSFNAIDASYTGLQLENPSNKVMITDPTQAKEQIMAEQDDDTDVIFMGVPTKAGEVKKMYMQDTARRKANNYNAAANDIFTLEDGIIELGKAMDLNKVTPKLGNFYKRAIETMVATGTDSHTLGFFELDENGQPIYNNNFPAILPKFTELFLSYFSKGVLSEKTPGTSVALVSSYGAKKFKKVLTIWKEGDTGYLPEMEGQPRTWKVITSAEVQQNPEYYRAIAKRWVGDTKEQQMERKFFNLQEGDIILDDLRHNYPKYSEDGRYLGRFSEFVMPAHYKEVMDKIPESLRYNFGIRIPSDDKHSYISLEYVDTLPVQYGSIGIFPQELIEISGADFDIDKLYMQFMDTYVSEGTRKMYGESTMDKDRFEEYLLWQAENNKAVKAKVEELSGTDEGLIAILLGDDRGVVLGALKELGMPSTVEEYISESNNGKEWNNGVLNNRILSGKIALLNNEHISADSVEKRAIINQPTSVDMLAGLVKKFRTMFTGMLNDVNTTEQDKKGLNDILSILTDPIADVNSIPGKVLAYSNNKEGSRNIGAAVNSMLTFSIMNQFDVSLTTPIMYGGNEYDTFGGDTTSDGVRKFAQISSIVNAMTDNAKERLAAKLGLNIEAVGYVSAAVAIGIPMESAVLLMLQPAVREYFSRIQNLKGALRTGDEMKTSRLGILPGMVQQYRNAVAREQKVEPKKVKIEMLSDNKLIKNIADGGISNSIQLAVLSMLSDIEELSNRMITVAGVTKLSKGLPTSFSDVDKIAKNLESLAPSLEPAIFEPYDALTKDNDIVATDIDIMQQVLQLSSKIFTERTHMFRTLSTDVESMMKVSEGVAGDAYRKQLRDDLVSYMDIAAYIQKLRREGGQGRMNTLNHSLIYSNDENNIIDRVQRMREQVRDSVQGENYLLNRYLSLVPTNGKDGRVNEIHTNSWTNLSEQVQEKMAAAFVDLYTNSHTTPNGQEIDTHTDAVALFNYLLVKDGGQFKNNSFVRYIPNFVFQDLLDSAGDVNEVLSREYSEQDIVDTFGMGSVELKKQFIESYGEHINNKRYIREVPVTIDRDSGQPMFYKEWKRPNNDILQYSAEDENTLPLYIKLPYSIGRGLFRMEWIANKEGRTEYPLDKGQTSGTGVTAQYRKIDWKGSPNTWKGAGVFGPLPNTPGASTQIVNDNPSYDIATPGRTETGSGDMQDIQQTEPLYTTPAQAIEKVGLKVYIQGNSFMVLESNVNAVPVPLEQYANQGFRTPTELGEWIMDRAGWYEEPIEKDENEQVVSEDNKISAAKALSDNIKDYEKGIADPNSTTIDNMERADLLYPFYKIEDVLISTLDLSQKSAGYSNNTSDYLKEDIKNGQNTPILINGRGQVVEGWHRIHSLKAIGKTTVRAYVPIKESEQPVVSSQTMESVQGENISSNSKGLAAALTNPTELAKSKGNLKQSYPIVYNGKEYKDVEAAYQANKAPYLKNRTTGNLMTELITIKLRTYPALVKGITDKGGVSWLENSTHIVKGDNYWETGEGKENAFMKSLIAAYKNVTQREPVQQPTTVPIVEQGRYITYNGDTYIVTKQNSNGTWQIYDPTKEGVQAKKSVSEKNLIPTANKASIVEYKGKEYIVTPKWTIISLTTNKKMEWGPENGDRKAILSMVQPTQLSPAEWKEQLSAIYKEKGITRPEREWTQEALKFRNSMRGTMSDTDIMNKIKECL